MKELKKLFLFSLQKGIKINFMTFGKNQGGDEGKKLFQKGRNLSSIQR